MNQQRPRKILHLDLDAFFCAVETLNQPALKGKAFAVGGHPNQRGVVASCSYPARQFGVRSAMPMSQALRLCPDLVIVPSRFQAYQTMSRQVMAELHKLSPLVEQLSIDEAFIDVSDLPEAAEAIARHLQARINQELQLPCSLGVASNKLVAKIANNIGKARVGRGRPPNTVTVVPPGQEVGFLAPLPVRELWGVGPKTAERLHTLGIETIGQLAQRSEAGMQQRFGKHGFELVQRARGIDTRPVETEHERKSVSRETTFARDVRDGAALRQTLRRLSESVGRQLRQQQLRGNTVRLKLRWPDFTTLSRQQTLSQPSNLDEAIYQAALALFEKTWSTGRAVRLIGVGVSGFETAAYQLGLWDASPEAAEDARLQATLDDLRQRFGEQSIVRGRDLDGDETSGASA